MMAMGTPRQLSEIQEQLGAVVRVIRDHLSKEKFSVWLFGSWAADQALPGSDIDVAISGALRVDDLTMARIRDAVDDLPTLRSFDVVDLAAIGESLRNCIRERHIVLD